jgi:hypothetical protein
MSDLQLITIPVPGQPSYPPQQVVGPFFGEQTNDLVIGSNNDFTLVSGLEETVQDVQKILLTEQGTPITLFPLYGTTLQSLIGNRMNPATISGTVQQQITQALQVLYLLTQNRSNPAEIVQTLYSLNTTVQSETNIAALLTVIAASGQEITTGVQIGNI